MNIDEEKIYLYLMNKSLLSVDEINAIEKRLRSDNEFSALVESIKNIRTEISAFDISKLNIDKITEKLLEHNKPVNVLHLQSIYKDNEENNIKLAAMQDLKNEDEFVYVNTYASAEKFVMVRVLKNTAAKQFRFYLVCDDMNAVRNALLRLDKIDEDFIADENGVAVINAETLPRHLDIKIFLPVARFYIDLTTLSESQTSDIRGKSFKATFNRISNTIKINFDNEILSNKKAYAILDGKISEFVKLIKDNENSLNLELRAGVSTFTLILIED